MRPHGQASASSSKQQQQQDQQEQAAGIRQQQQAAASWPNKHFTKSKPTKRRAGPRTTVPAKQFLMFSAQRPVACRVSLAPDSSWAQEEAVWCRERRRLVSTNTHWEYRLARDTAARAKSGLPRARTMHVPPACVRHVPPDARRATRHPAKQPPSIAQYAWPIGLLGAPRN